MKYTDYRIENLVFMKGVDNWTTEQKKEFLETCPENQDLPQILAELEDVKKALESGEIKTNKYKEINKASMKAYLNKHDTHIHYGNTSRGYYYSSGYKDIYFRADGTYRTLVYGDAMSIDSTIKWYTSDKHIEKRFDLIANAYREKENGWSQRIENERYTAINKDRIEANQRLDKALDTLSICVPTSIKSSDYGYYTYDAYRLTYSSYSHYHTQYGEITVNGQPLSKAKADKLCDAITEMSAKIQEVAKEYETVFAEVFGKRTDER